MSNADRISILLAGVALLVAAVVAFVAYRSPRHRSRAVAPAPSPTQAVAVRLVTRPSEGPGYWWRLEVVGDGAPTSFDFLSFKIRNRDGQWHHELMDAPLMIAAPEVVYLRAPALTHAGDAYDVSVGWTDHRSGTPRPASAILTVEPEPAATH